MAIMVRRQGTHDEEEAAGAASGALSAVTLVTMERGAPAPAGPAAAQWARLPGLAVTIQTPAPTVVAPKATATGREAMLRRKEWREPHGPAGITSRRRRATREDSAPGLGAPDASLVWERKAGAVRPAMHVEEPFCSALITASIKPAHATATWGVVCAWGINMDSKGIVERWVVPEKGLGITQGATNAGSATLVGGAVTVNGPCESCANRMWGSGLGVWEKIEARAGVHPNSAAGVSRWRIECH